MMLDFNQLCFKEDFLRWFMRGGGALCAESEAWGKLERNFGRIYVPHQADEEILRTLSEKADDPELGFLLVLVGMPGSGKTLLLKELVSDLRSDHFSEKCKPMIEKIKKAFEFRDVADIVPFAKRKEKGDYPTKKRVVWVTTALDDFVDTSAEVKECLQTLEKKLNLGMAMGESLIIFGNRGILGDVLNHNDPVVHRLYLIVGQRNQKHFEFLRIPKETNVFWIKQFGIEDPLFGLTNGVEGFREYSKSLLSLSENYLSKCTQNKKDNSKCKNCLADVFLRYIAKLNEMLEDLSLITRTHDLLHFLWLRHCDLYLTPRALNLFWGYFLFNLWKMVREKREREEDVDKSLIYEAIYSSRLPSIRGPEEYSLSEARVHKYRNEKFESEVLSRCERTLLDKRQRLRERLKLFFSEANKEYKKMINDGALGEYADQQQLLSRMNQVLQKLALLRPMYTSGKKKLSERIGRSWSLEKLLFGPITELVQKREPKKKAKRLPVVIFDNRLFRNITFRGFRIVPDDVRYLEMREKVLHLEVKVEDEYPSKLPCLNLNLQDYEILRDFTSKIKEPDLSLNPSLRREIHSFVRDLNGTADYLVGPLMTDYLKDRANRNDEVGLSLHSINHGRDCDVKFTQNQMVVSVAEENYVIDLGAN